MLPSKQDVFVGAVPGFISFNSAGLSQKALLDINVPRAASPGDINVPRAVSPGDIKTSCLLGSIGHHRWEVA